MLRQVECIVTGIPATRSLPGRSPSAKTAFGFGDGQQTGLSGDLVVGERIGSGQGSN